MKAAVLMVTRENAADRRYGLGKSLAPVVDELSRQGLSVRYLCQEDLPLQWVQRRQLRYGRLIRWPVLRKRQDLQTLLSAWLERLDMGLFAARLVANEGYSHVHLHDPWMGAGFWLGLKLRRLVGVCWGVTEHGFGSYSRATYEDGLKQGAWTQRLMRHLESRVLAAADWVIAPTQRALNQLAEDLFVNPLPRHWHVVPHARPKLRLLGLEAARRQLGWSPEDIYVLGVGRLVPLKRFDQLLEIVIELSARRSGVRLCLLGEGGEGQRLLDRASELNWEDRLIITSTDDVGLYMAASDLYVSLSATESFGLANAEALCAGLPSVCTAVGGVPEVLGEGARLIDEGLAEAAGVIEQMIASPEIRADWSGRSMRAVRKWPEIENIGEAYVAIYAAAAGVKARPVATM
jgi:glycosyltransferase involved in cell wall biosynthesis